MIQLNFFVIVNKPKANVKANQMFMPLFTSLNIRLCGHDNVMPMPYMLFLMAGSFMYSGVHRFCKNTWLNRES